MLCKRADSGSSSRGPHHSLLRRSPIALNLPSPQNIAAEVTFVWDNVRKGRFCRWAMDTLDGGAQPAQPPPPRPSFPYASAVAPQHAGGSPGRFIRGHHALHVLLIPSTPEILPLPHRPAFLRLDQVPLRNGRPGGLRGAEAALRPVPRRGLPVRAAAGMVAALPVVLVMCPSSTTACEQHTTAG